MWRLLTHPQMKVSRAEIEREWCLDDVTEAHRILDEIDDYMARQHAKR
jgi:hypothetical protein